MRRTYIEHKNNKTKLQKLETRMLCGKTTGRPHSRGHPDQYRLIDGTTKKPQKDQPAAFKIHSLCALFVCVGDLFVCVYVCVQIVFSFKERINSKSYSAISIKIHIFNDKTMSFRILKAYWCSCRSVKRTVHLFCKFSIPQSDF